MNKEQFLNKWNMKEYNLSYYKKLQGGKLDLAKLDIELSNRLDMLYYMRDIMADIPAKNIYPAFIDKGSNYRQIAVNWLSTLYTDRVKVVNIRFYNKMIRVKKHLEELR